MANFRVFLLVINLFIGYCELCDLNSSLEDASACDFDGLMLVNAQTGFTLAEANCGIEIDKDTFADQPYVFYPYAKEDLKYTVVMIDNDDPFTEDGKEFLQWLIVNVDGASLKYGMSGFYGETVAAYLAPDPAQESCVHRYSIYVYEQIFSPLTFPDPPPLRSDFSLQDFVENITPKGAICGPVASIEFQTRF